MTTYPLMLTLRIVRKRTRLLALIAERHGLALGRAIGRRQRETKEKAA